MESKSRQQPRSMISRVLGLTISQSSLLLADQVIE